MVGNTIITAKYWAHHYPFPSCTFKSMSSGILSSSVDSYSRFKYKKKMSYSTNDTIDIDNNFNKDIDIQIDYSK